MKRFSEQLKKRSLAIRLSAAEKRDVRERLISYMEYHPLPEKTEIPKIKAVETAPYRLISIPSRYLKASFGAVAALVLVVMPALAEQAIPGDILYPVKIQVNEEIRSTLSRSPFEKVAWETERLERRVTEARTLALEGRLTPEVEADVLAAVKAHTSAAESEIETLMNTDAEAAGLAQMTFASKLDVQSVILRSARSSSTEMAMSTDPTSALAGVIEEGREAAIGKSAKSPVSFERIMAQLELETTRAHELLRSISKTATVKERTDIERRLADIERAINEAAGAHGEEPEAAIEALKSSWRDTQKLIKFMSDINVRSSVSVESLVPVVPTYEERLIILEEDHKLIEQEVKRIKQGLSVVDNEDILEKIELALPQIEEMLLVASSTDREVLRAAEMSIKAAKELTNSLLSLADFPMLADEELQEVDIEVPINEGTTTASTTNDTGSTSASTSVPVEPLEV